MFPFLSLLFSLYFKFTKTWYSGSTLLFSRFHISPSILHWGFLEWCIDGGSIWGWLMVWSKLTRASSMLFGLCRLLGGGEGAAVVGGGLLSRVEQLSLREEVSREDRPGLCGGILGVLRSVEGVFRNVVPGGKCSNHQGRPYLQPRAPLGRPKWISGSEQPRPPILGAL
jgi:hypothetical protein